MRFQRFLSVVTISIAASLVLTLVLETPADARPFRARAYQSTDIAPRYPNQILCDPELQIATTAVGELDQVLFPSEADLDAMMARFSSCNFEHFTMWHSIGSYRIFPGQKPYYIDPFEPGALPPEYARLKEDYSNITAADAMAEPALWRLISAYVIFDQLSEFYDDVPAEKRVVRGDLKAARSTVDAFGFKTRSPVDTKGLVVLTQADLDRVRPLVNGARIKAVRALLWQYQQMKSAPEFSLNQCARFGAAQIALGYNTQNRPRETAPVAAYEHFAFYNEEFRKLALPKLLASFGRVEDYSKLVNEGGGYSQSVWKAIPSYQCVRDATGYVLVATSNTIEAARSAQLEAERLAVEAESRRRQQAAQDAIARNARAASGNFAPVDDDILRAVIDARRDAIAPDVAVGNALIPGETFSYIYNYETGYYWERMMGMQEIALQHQVRNTRCTRITAQPVLYDCSFEMRADVAVSIFGMSAPKLEFPFLSHSEKLRFVNGAWSVDGLTERYRQGRRQQSSASNYDHSKGIRAFYCISSNNFADQFGLVRELDC